MRMRQDIREIIDTKEESAPLGESPRAELSPRYIRSFMVAKKKRGVEWELKTWLKILRCGRKWISDTRNATLFGTITRESPSKPPISIPAPAGNIFTRSEGTYLRLGTRTRRTGWHVNKKKGRSRNSLIFPWVLFIHANVRFMCYDKKRRALNDLLQRAFRYDIATRMPRCDSSLHSFTRG